MKIKNTIFHILYTTLYTILLCLILPQIAQAATYYVDATLGNDNNNGLSQQNCWKTINKVNSMHFSPGDSVLFKSGNTWTEQLTIPSSGTNTNPITFGAYGTGANPIIDGAEICILANGKNYVIVENIECKNAKSNGVFFYKSNNNIIRNVISSFCYSDGITLADDCSQNLLENCITHDNGHVGTEPQGPGIHLHTRAHDNIITNCTSYNNTKDGIGLAGNDDTNWVGINNIVQNCSFYGNSESGIDCKNGPQIIRWNKFFNNTGIVAEGAGILVDFKANNILVYGNDIYSNATDGIKVFCEGGGNHFYSNRIYENGGDGIDVEGKAGGTYETTINHNLIYNNNENGIIFHNDYSHDAFVYNNVIWENHGSYQLLFSAANPTAKNNIIGGTNTLIGFRQQAINGADSNNNLLNGTNRFCMWNYVYYSFQSYKTATGQDSNSLVADPLFLNYTTKDFHLQSNSPAIDSGIDVGLTEDFEGNTIPQGNAPDIGAYEFGNTGVLFGDVSGDGIVSAYDAALVAQAVVGLRELNPEQVIRADVSGDGRVSAYDAALIAQYAVGLRTEFPTQQ